ncbi:MAG: hypothetical protein KJ069_16290 [Anaerolineae bacterium]|nr:hypothetical protein [Anaerolineae bacterium]
MLFPHQSTSGMRKRTLQQFKEISNVFHWAEKRHYIWWFTGKDNGRHKFTEHNLPLLVEKGILKEHGWGKKKVYAAWGSPQHIEHGLACTECLMRFVVSDVDCTLIGEKHFAGIGCKPEWGIKYPNDKLLVAEVSTLDNSTRSGLISRKVEAYRRYLANIESKFDAKAIVLFVIDLPREKVTRMVANYLDGDPIFFVDFESFKEVALMHQLTAPIYIWGDGNTYPLRNHD